MKNISIIPAEGTGNRLNAGIPKQFIKVADKTILEHTLCTFPKIYSEYRNIKLTYPEDLFLLEKLISNQR